MLTRCQVARRLGKSIATVRRMEGHELASWVDERGVHRFDLEQVEEAALSRGSGRTQSARLSGWLSNELTRRGENGADIKEPARGQRVALPRSCNRERPPRKSGPAPALELSSTRSTPDRVLGSCADLLDLLDSLSSHEWRHLRKDAHALALLERVLASLDEYLAV
jgi:hypothetical protein